MNSVQEYLIRKRARARAQEFVGEDKYVKNLVLNEAKVEEAGLVYDKVSKMREMIAVPSVHNREIKETDAMKTLLISGTIGAAGAITACALAGGDLGATSLITMSGGLGGMVLGEVGMQIYKANIENKIATAIKRNRLRRQMSKAEREEKKAELYSRTLEEELDLV